MTAFEAYWLRKHEGRTRGDKELARGVWDEAIEAFSEALRLAIPQGAQRVQEWRYELREELKRK